MFEKKIFLEKKRKNICCEGEGRRKYSLSFFSFFFVSFSIFFFFLVFSELQSYSEEVPRNVVCISFYTHYFVSGKCHVVHSPNRAPQHHHPTGDF